jgi:hypothetical protein
MAVITEVLGHLRSSAVSSTFFVNWLSSPFGAHQIDALFLGLSQQLFGQLPMIQFGGHGIEYFGHR